MTINIRFHNANNLKHLYLYAERVDERITRKPFVYDIFHNERPRMKDAGMMRSLFIVTAYISHSYDIDGDSADETPSECKDYIEYILKDSSNAWWKDTGANGDSAVIFEWVHSDGLIDTYVGTITKVDITELGGEPNHYSVIIEFEEGQLPS